MTYNYDLKYLLELFKINKHVTAPKIKYNVPKEIVAAYRHIIKSNPQCLLFYLYIQSSIHCVGGNATSQCLYHFSFYFQTTQLFSLAQP